MVQALGYIPKYRESPPSLGCIMQVLDERSSLCLGTNLKLRGTVCWLWYPDSASSVGQNEDNSQREKLRCTGTRSRWEGRSSASLSPWVQLLWRTCDPFPPSSVNAALCSFSGPQLGLLVTPLPWASAGVTGNASTLGFSYSN